MNSYALFGRQARYQPERPALVEEGRTLSYAALDRLAGQYATALRQAGIGVGDRVGVLLKERAAHLVLLLALERMGAVVAVLDWRAPPVENERIAAVLEAKLLLTEPASPAVGGIPCLAIDERWERGAAALPLAPIHPARPEEPVKISLSSGTTGLPKGAVATYGQGYHRFVAGMMAFGWRAEDRYLSCVPFCFSAGRDYAVYILRLGGTVVLMPPLFTAADYVTAVERFGITAGLLTPTPLRWLMEAAAGKAPLLPGMQRLATIGAELHAEEKAKLYRTVTPGLIEAFGTAATGVLTRLAGEALLRRGDSMGRVLPTAELEIVDRQDRPVASGEDGILRVRGPGVASEMIGEETGEGPASLRDGWFYPGDLVRRDEEGYLQLKGRAADLIIRGGVNIYPAEIEKLLLTHPAVAEAAVVGRPSAELGEEVAAFVTARTTLDAGLLRQFCRERLAAYKVPRDFILVADLPRTAAGKVLKRALAARLTPL
jgi:acyl-coenzyme A synthetase/AMP-(fatty) acid ligase